MGAEYGATCAHIEISSGMKLRFIEPGDGSGSDYLAKAGWSGEKQANELARLKGYIL